MLPARKNPHDLRPQSTVQQSRRLRLWGRTVCQPRPGRPHSRVLCCEPSNAAAEEAARRPPVWKENTSQYILHLFSYSHKHTSSHLLLDVQCIVTDVPDLKPACRVSRDQDGVFRLIWAQAQHTLTRLLWSTELAWNEEGKTELYSCTFPNIKKPSKI